MVYFGPAKKVMWYFEQIGFHIANGVNPADFCLDVLSGQCKPKISVQKVNVMSRTLHWSSCWVCLRGTESGEI